MVGGAGTFACCVYPGFAEPTDSTAPATASCVGAYVGKSGQIVAAAGTKIVAAQFTTVGGKPKVGDIAYLAAAFDDSGTARGKLTATRPQTGIPVDTSIFGGNPTQSEVRVARVVDVSLYDSAKTCDVVLLGGAMAPEPTPIQDYEFTGFGLGGFSGANYYSIAGNTAGLEFADQQCWVFHWLFDKPVNITGYLFSNQNGAETKGFDVHQNGTVILIKVCAGTSTTLSTSAPRRGVNCLVIWIANSTLYAALNGVLYSTALLAAPVAPDGTCTATLGQYGPSPNNSWQFNGKIFGVSKLERAPLVSEALYWSSVGLPQAPRSRYALPEPLYFPRKGTGPSEYSAADWVGGWTVATPPGQPDPSLVWSWGALSGIGTAVDGPKGFTWTLHGTLTSTEILERWYMDIGANLLNTGPVSLDSNGIAVADTLATLEWTAGANNPDVGVLYVNNDPIDYDNQALALLWDGINPGVSSFNVVPDGPRPFPTLTPIVYWMSVPYDRTTAAGTHTVQVIGASQHRGASTPFSSHGGRVRGVVTSAGVTFGTSTAAKRMVIVGSSDMLAHDTNPAYNALLAPPTLMRADFSGAITAWCAGARGLWDVAGLGGSDVLPLVHRVIQRGEEGNPTTVIVYTSLGFADYNLSRWTPAQFGAFYQAYYAALHALRPTWHLFAEKVIQAHWDSTANGLGHTQAEYNAQIDALAVALPYVTAVNARAPNTITFGSDNIRLIDNTPYYQNIKAALGGLY